MRLKKSAHTVKKNSSKALREKFDFLKKVYWDGKGIWGAGFFVSTVSIDEATIRRYVELQGTEEAGQAELEV